jgi:gliding motility-associatede transport system auxiliary component
MAESSNKAGNQPIGDANPGKGSAGKALTAAGRLKDQAAGWLLLAPGEANRVVGRLGRASMTWIAICLGAVILLSVNVIASSLFKGSSADLTASHLYTISDSTKRVLGKLTEPIDVRVYYSSKLGEASSIYNRYFERVRALLEEYATMSGGKLKLAFIDPVPFSDAEDRAVSSGLQGVQLNAEGEKGYFGLVATNSTDQTETVSFFSPQREAFLEYDMTKLIHKLAAPKLPVVGLISGLQINGGFDMRARQPVQPWQIITQIKEFFEVEDIPQNTESIPKDVDVLMLVHPNGLTAKAAYAIDQFALRGGRILAFVDPVSELSKIRAPQLGSSTNNPELMKLLKSWGVKFDPKLAAGDIETARRVQLGGAQPVVTEFVVWLGLRGDSNLEQSDVVSDGVKVLNMVTPGFLEPIKGASTKFLPIARTSSKAMEISTSKLMGPQPDPVALLRDYKPGGKSLVIAARVDGPISSAYPDGPPEKKTKKGEKGKSKDEKSAKTNTDTKTAPDKKSAKVGADKKKGGPLTKGKLNAIIVADTDFLYDQFWVQTRQVFGQQMMVPTAHNGVFVINALENLSGGEALSGLRGRGVDERPFDTVDAIRRHAEQEFRQREKVLSAKLENLRKQLSQVEQKSGSGALMLSDEDKKAIDKFKTELLETRRQLRNVKHAMRADIDRLEGRLKFINIAVVPLLIGLGGFAFAAYRRRNRHGARGPGSTTS